MPLKLRIKKLHLGRHAYLIAKVKYKWLLKSLLGTACPFKCAVLTTLLLPKFDIRLVKTII